MATPLEGRRPTYMDRYARALNAQYRVARIQKDIQSEQDRIQYLDSLIAAERQTLNGLRDTLRAQARDFSTADALLKEQADLIEQQRTATAAAGQAARAAVTMSARDEAAIRAVMQAGNRERIMQTVEDLVRGATPQRAKAIIDEAQRTGVPSRRLTATDIGTLRVFAQTQATGTVPGVDPRIQEGIDLRQQAIDAAQESAYFAGPEGITGGYDGLEIVNLRNLTPQALRERASASEAAAQEALARAAESEGDEKRQLERDAAAARAEKERLDRRADALDEQAGVYATADDALEAALAIVRATGDPANIENEYARSIYEEARQFKAYTNSDRADYDEDVLDSRKRLAELETEKEALQGRYDDPRKEFLRRELTARGYTFYDGADEWKNQFVRYQNTPDYEIYLDAYQRYQGALNDEKPIEPTSRAENIITSYTMMLNRRGQPINIPVLRKQLDKAGITGREQNDAIAFAMAYWEAGGPDQDPAQLALAKRDEEAREQERRLQTERAEAKERDVQMQREVTADLEREQVAAVGELRGEQAERRRFYDEYTRQRAMGKTADEAREIARNMATMAEMTTGFGQQPSDAAGRILMQPDYLMERQRRVGARREADAAARQRAAADIQFGPGEVVAAEPAQPVAPAPKVGEVGFEFVDESDPSKTRYRRTEDGFAVVQPDGSVGATILGPSTAGVALTLAERGEYDKVADLQRRMRAARTPTPPPAAPAPAPTPTPPPPATTAPAAAETPAQRMERLRRERAERQGAGR